VNKTLAIKIPERISKLPLSPQSGFHELATVLENAANYSYIFNMKILLMN
jgi:hypothetical protein